jgi:hypothetical protein
MTPLTPLHLNSILGAGSQGVGIATLIFRYFLRYFSSTHRTDLSRFRGEHRGSGGQGLGKCQRACLGLPIQRVNMRPNVGKTVSDCPGRRVR